MNISETTFEASDISQVSDFIRKRNTAVITTMFTDIKGFTEMTERKGDAYSSSLREAHDKIVQDIIEENGMGVVVKFIGDAVMAIFSEPSEAVKRALKIQSAIDHFNRTNDEFEDISIRIGLHMGQVAVEEKIQADVFGRHVNRASRIESMADGGQIFMSYPVFDSAKGWIQGSEHLKWQLHGNYFLKGIDNAVEIYEIVDTRLRQPKAPRKGKKKRAFPKTLTSIILILLGVIGAVGYMKYEETEIHFRRFYPQNFYLNGTTEIILDGKADDELRRSLTDIPYGTHFLHYNVSQVVRYYGSIDVKRGINYLEPKYTYVMMPYVSVRSGLEDKSKSNTREHEYFLYDHSGKKFDKKATLKLTVTTEKDKANEGHVIHVITYSIVMNGKEIVSDSITDSHNPKDKTKRPTPPVVWEDSLHKFELQYYLTHETADVRLTGLFKPY